LDDDENHENNHLSYENTSRINIGVVKLTSIHTNSSTACDKTSDWNLCVMTVTTGFRKHHMVVQNDVTYTVALRDQNMINHFDHNNSMCTACDFVTLGLRPYGDPAASKKKAERRGERRRVSYSATGAPWACTKDAHDRSRDAVVI
jgi:hypothetical protein